MATFTAQVLVGHSHPNHDGIIPTHAIMVSENSRAALVMVPFRVYSDRTPTADTAIPGNIVWIPHPDHVVDDLVLQVCVHILRDPAVTTQADAVHVGLTRADHYDLTDLSPADRGALSSACRDVTNLPKLVVTLLGGSLLTRNITRFEDYAMDIEVCPVAYQRQYSVWTQKTHISGDLGEIQR